MSPEIYAEFAQIFETRLSAGGPFNDVLEVGALPDERSLLLLPQLASARHRIGVNLNEEGKVGTVNVVKGDARALSFESERFDLVLSSSTLEHIPEFWRACSEMRRVLRPGGYLLIVVPGFGPSPAPLRRLQRVARRLGRFKAFQRTTLTFTLHDHPHDYYRFSREAVRDVLLSELESPQVWAVLTPPRIFGLARKSLQGEPPST